MTPNETPTPLTDALWQNPEYEALRDDHKIARWSDHARALERRNAELTAALVWARENLGKHTRPSPIDKALDGVEIPPNPLEKRNAELVEALSDMLSGWRYIRATHGDLYGVGWDRAQTKAEQALAAQEGGEG